jgi:microcystin-dependent protein
MASLTPKYKLPYPERTHSVDPARDIKALAEAIDAVASGGMPVGSILVTGGTVYPAGWLPCDGRPHNSPELQAMLGSPNTPNLTGVSLIGASSTTPLHTKGGSATAAITMANMPSHTHALGGNSGGGGAMGAHQHPMATAAVGSGGSGPVEHQHRPVAGTHFPDSNTNNTDRFTAGGGPMHTSGTLSPPTQGTAPGGVHGHPNATMNYPGLQAAGSPHAHGINIANAGSGASVNRPNVPASTALTFIVRAT